MQVLKGGARRTFLAIAGALGLSGCVSDPAFMEGLAMATQAMAVETSRMAEDAACYRHLSVSGEWITLCPLPPGYVAPPPRPGRDGRYRDRDRKDRW
ncbi:MAG: hypothetical protein Q8S03_15055 [Brevundimonas sp.]|uniref:hypothetical protein n=1 Tax=Brevundimonas sp. TaxID=1871086 RepID=UPI0027343F5C|nr:hypothetical protein [Brevundimonas sp.]MBX9616277.1 hypothetical protein [Caulobacteraceae bacterium]MDP3406007.1 hypothetical protein [Brevundimonas sp.]